MINVIFILALVVLFTTSSLIAHHIIKERVRKRLERLVTFFNRLSRAYNLSLSNKEILKDVVIGLDETQKKLLIVQYRKDNYDWHLVKLENVSDCSIRKDHRNINVDSIKGRRFDEYLNKVLLQVILKDSTEKIEVPFYVFGKNHMAEANDLTEKAIYWKSLVSNVMQNETQMRA